MKKIFLVMEREIMVRVKKKYFIIMTLLMPVLLALAAIAPVVVMQIKSGKEKRIAVLDESGVIGANLKDADAVHFVVDTMPLETLKNTLAAGNIYAILHAAADTMSIAMYSSKPVGSDILGIVSGQIKNVMAQNKLAQLNMDYAKITSILNPRIDIKTYVLDEHGAQKQSSASALTAAALAAGLLIFLIIFMFGIQIMRGVIEEKTSRIIEVIISSIKPMQLMMGKILGVALVVLLQLMIWGLLFALIMAVFNMAVSLHDHADSAAFSGMWSNMQTLPMGRMMVCFLLYLVLGYLLYASLFAIAGSAVDNETDVQQLQTIITMPLIIGYIIMMAVSAQPDHPLGFWGSMIPFTSPLVMLARIPFGVECWEIALSLAILAAAFVFFTWIAARIYRVGILMYGKKPTLREIIRWARYKG
jgi:ABC-2 type transport system permease protein